MGITKTLWKVVRRPMIRWWLRSGSWWLVVFASVNIGQTLILLQYSSITQFIPTDVVRYSINIVPLIPLVVLVVAASICDGLVFQFYEQHAAPMPRGILWGRYLLALGQVIPIAIVSTIVSIVYLILLRPEFFAHYGNAMFVAYAIVSPMVNLASLAVNGIWLVLFVVIATRRPIFQYGLMAAILFTKVLNAILGISVLQLIHFPTPYWYSQPDMQYLYFLAIPLWLLFANAVKQGRVKIATALQTIILVSVIGHMGIFMLHLLYDGIVLYGLTLTAEFIASPYYFHANLGSPIINWFANRFDLQETVLGYLPFLLKTILAWLQPCFLLGVIYLFVFSSYPKGWVDFWRKKLQSL